MATSHYKALLLSFTSETIISNILYTRDFCETGELFCISFNAKECQFCCILLAYLSFQIVVTVYKDFHLCITLDKCVDTKASQKTGFMENVTIIK